MYATHPTSSHPSSQFHPHDGGPLTSTPIRDIRRGLNISEIGRELDKTVTSIIMGSDTDTTLSDCTDGDGFEIASDSNAAAASPEAIDKGKGKDPLVRKGQFYGKGQRRRVASGSPPLTVSGANPAQRTAPLFPSRSPSPISSSSESSSCSKPAIAQRMKSVKRKKHGARGHERKKLCCITSALSPDPCTTTTTTDPATVTTTTGTSITTIATASTSCITMKQSQKSGSRGNSYLWRRCKCYHGFPIVCVWRGSRSLATTETVFTM